jgi:hypothetical protein
MLVRSGLSGNGCAVPNAGTALDAFLAVEIRHATITERDGLAAANIGVERKARAT